MIEPDENLGRAHDILEEHGCPICGEPADFLTVQFIDAIRITPCSHLVLIEDALHMEEFYEELHAAEVSGDL